MIRPLTGVCMLLAAGSGLYLYQTKHQSQLLERDIARVLKLADTARERAGVLHAEYALLNDPSRLSELATQHLTLSTLDSRQFVSWPDLGRVLADKAPVLAHLPDPAEPAEPAEPMAAATPAAPPASPPAAAPVLLASRPEGARVEAAKIAAPAAPARTLLASSTSPSGAAAPGSSAILQTPLPPPTRSAARLPVAATTATPSAPAAPASRASAAPSAPMAPQPAMVRQPSAQPAAQPPVGSASEAASRIVRNLTSDPAVPAVASALGMARSMLRVPSPISPANAATISGGGGG